MRGDATLGPGVLWSLFERLLSGSDRLAGPLTVPLAWAGHLSQAIPTIFIYGVSQLTNVTFGWNVFIIASLTSVFFSVRYVADSLGLNDSVALPIAIFTTLNSNLIAFIGGPAFATFIVGAILLIPLVSRAGSASRQQGNAASALSRKWWVVILITCIYTDPLVFSLSGMILIFILGRALLFRGTLRKTLPQAALLGVSVGLVGIILNFLLSGTVRNVGELSAYGLSWRQLIVPPWEFSAGGLFTHLALGEPSHASYLGSLGLLGYVVTAWRLFRSGWPRTSEQNQLVVLKSLLSLGVVVTLLSVKRPDFWPWIWPAELFLTTVPVTRITSRVVPFLSLLGLLQLGIHVTECLDKNHRKPWLQGLKVSQGKESSSPVLRRGMLALCLDLCAYVTNTRFVATSRSEWLGSELSSYEVGDRDAVLVMNREGLPSSEFFLWTEHLGAMSDVGRSEVSSSGWRLILQEVSDLCEESDSVFLSQTGVVMVFDFRANRLEICGDWIPLETSHPVFGAGFWYEVKKSNQGSRDVGIDLLIPKLQLPVNSLEEVFALDHMTISVLHIRDRQVSFGARNLVLFGNFSELPVAWCEDTQEHGSSLLVDGKATFSFKTRCPEISLAGLPSKNVSFDLVRVPGALGDF